MFDLQGQSAIDTMDIIRNRTLESVRIGIKWYKNKIDEYSNDIKSGEYNDKQTAMLKKMIDDFIKQRNELISIDDSLDTRNLTVQKAEKAINTFIKTI